MCWPPDAELGAVGAGGGWRGVVVAVLDPGVLAIAAGVARGGEATCAYVLAGPGVAEAVLGVLDGPEAAGCVFNLDGPAVTVGF